MIIIINIRYLINQLIIDVIAVLSIAFYTLIERKVLRYRQNRKGPNKIRIEGVVQPISDALKLLRKKEFKLTFSNNLFYWIPPFYSFLILITILNLTPNKNNLTETNYGWMVFFCFIALLRFRSIIMGWSSNSKYTLLGSLRGLAQSISYEVILIISIIILLIIINRFRLTLLFKEKMIMFFFFWMIRIFFFVSLVCEVNRAPFDLAEGESELVRGFNTEYGITKFSLIFLTEYGIIIFIRIIIVNRFNNYIYLTIYIKILIIITILLWLRASYPRIRYDLLMYWTWKNILRTVILISLFIILIL